MRIKIYSWNVLYKNKDFKKILEFLQSLDFDIFALQEVPEDFIPQLKKLPYFLSQGVDWNMLTTSASNGAPNQINLVILSRYPIQNETIIPLPNYAQPKRWPLRVRLLQAMGWKHPFSNKSALRVELLLSNAKVIQVFCAHLELFIPETRQREFDEIIQHKKNSMPAIVCGDFNLLELPHITLLNWLAGGRFSDFIFWWRERRVFKKKLSEYSLTNPLRGKMTHPIAFSQIDHILISNDMEVIAKHVLSDTVGSDHHPVMVEVKTGE